MLFRLLKIPARLALPLYCRTLRINDTGPLQMKGPLLIACNHPNSFLDAILLATLFKKPIYSLARGDVFTNKYVTALLKQLHILPVYRISEGAENLNSNYDTFAQCREIFKKNGIVLIFSEGLCVNEWKLRPLKKGTARLIYSCWEENINLTILPTGINYHSFRDFGKNVIINFGKPLTRADFANEKSDGFGIKKLTERLQKDLKVLVEEIEDSDSEKLHATFLPPYSSLKKSMLYVPAQAGKWIHAPLYLPLKKITLTKAADSDHYDSIIVGLLMLLYPLYLFIIALLVFYFAGSWYWLFTFLLLPLMAWSYLQLRRPFKP